MDNFSYFSEFVTINKFIHISSSHCTNLYCTQKPALQIFLQRQAQKLSVENMADISKGVVLALLRKHFQEVFKEL